MSGEVDVPDEVGAALVRERERSELEQVVRTWVQAGDGWEYKVEVPVEWEAV